MKNVLVLLTILLSLNTHAVVLEKNSIQEGQVVSVIGWKNMMPGPGKKPSLGNIGAVNVSFIAFSGGCTSAESFEVKIVELEADKLTYKLEVVRVIPDFCEALFEPQILTKELYIPIEAFIENAEFLSKPYTSVGVAY